MWGLIILKKQLGQDTRLDWGNESIKHQIRIRDEDNWYKSSFGEFNPRNPDEDGHKDKLKPQNVRHMFKYSIFAEILAMKWLIISICIGFDLKSTKFLQI